MALEAILDIGSSKVVCLIAGLGAENRLEVFGVGHCVYRGIRRGGFLDPRSLREAIMTALDQAQTEARRSIRSISIGVPGPFLETFCRRGELYFDQPQIIQEQDVDSLIEYSLSGDEMPGFSRLLSVAVSYKLDEVTSMSLPKNAKAQRLEGIFSHIFVREEFKENLEAILEEAQISIDSYVDSTYAESLLIIPSHRMREDCVVVDIGYYHTDVCIMRNGAPISHKTIQVGGAHFANDISYVIGVLPEEAESVKRRHVFGLDYSHRSDNYHMQDGSVVSFDYDHIQNIIEARANEIIDMVGDAIKKSPIDINANTPLFLCGGGMAMMRGGREFIQSRIGMMVSTELPPMPRRNSSNNISAYGVMVYQLENSSSSKQDWKDKSFIQSVLSFFTK